MNDAISQADNFAPLYLGALGPEILRQAIGGFADDFQIAYEEVDGFIVFYQSVVIQPGYVTFDFLNPFPNILDIDGCRIYLRKVSDSNAFGE